MAADLAPPKLPVYHSTLTLIFGTRVTLDPEQLAMAKAADPAPRIYPDPVFFELFGRCFPNMPPSHLVLMKEERGGDVAAGGGAGGEPDWWVGAVLEFVDLELNHRVEALSFGLEGGTVESELGLFSYCYPDHIVPHSSRPNCAARFTPHAILWSRA